MSFEDILDLCSAMSEKCPDSVKAAWAFRILGKNTFLVFQLLNVVISDFDGDGYVGEEDLAQVIQRLTGNEGYITEPEQKHIIKIVSL